MANREYALPEKQQQSNSGWGRVAILVAGDMIVFLVFALSGRSSHGEGNAVLDTIRTAGPFILSWFVISPFFGLFRSTITSEPRKMSQRVALALLIACPIAILLRAVVEQRPVANYTFWLIAFGFNLIVLLLWRGSFAWVTRKK